MKRTILTVLIALAFLITAGTASAQDEEECYWNTSTTVDLIAGQHYDMGSVVVGIDDGNLTVTYYADEDWLIYETHLNVSMIPIADAAPGQFPYKHEDLGGVEMDQYIIPLGDFGLNDTCECVNGDCTKDLYIAAHAVVDNYGGTLGEQTAWGNGTEIGDNWAMYFSTELTCECDGGGTSQEIPEFPTIALPIAAIIGLAFLMQRKKE